MTVVMVVMAATLMLVVVVVVAVEVDEALISMIWNRRTHARA
jgi:hypothetical protein